jgi:transcriptional regulator with XRE-family HTH domain
VTTQTAERALRRLLDVLDGEDWEALVAMLDEDVELADELTTTWLRGRERVSAYLRASAGVVTEIESLPADVTSRALAQDEILSTFNLRQRYNLDGVEQRRYLTGCVVFRAVDGEPRLTLFHLGEAATLAADESLADAPPLADAEETSPTLGERIRVQRDAKGLSLRALAAATGLSPSFLSQVERGRASASVATLERVAEALGTSPADLVSERRDSGTIRAGRRGELGSIRLHELGMMIETFPGLPNGGLESWVAELDPNAPAFTPVGGSGSERFLYVLDGTITLVGHETTVLSAGEGAHLRSADYRIAAHGGHPARYLCTQVRT